jgi:hypothetical protein
LTKKEVEDLLAERIGLPPTTLQSMLTRGVGRASVDNVIKVCRSLGITVEQLEKLASRIDSDYEPETIAAHHDGEEWTEDALEDIEKFKEFVKMRREQKEKEGNR